MFLVLLINASAQTCTGSVGDPIVNITFGSGSSTFGPPLPAGSTSSISYQAQNCPVDGNYAITNYTSGCWPNDVVWHTAKDHTGGGNGYYMLVNASNDPSDFYVQTVSGLCEGTQYQFAAWLLNLCSVSGRSPNIKMTIETTGGSTLAKYETGDIPIINPVTWSQYGFNFTTPAGISTVVLRMHNNSPGGVGNDLGLDDITFRPIGPAVAVTTSASDGDTITLCESNTASLQLSGKVEQCYVSNAYQWQLSMDNGSTWKDITGATNLTYNRLPTTAGIYLYRLAVAEENNIGITTCRVTSKPVTLIVYPVDQRTISISKNNETICEGSATTFTAQTTNGGSAPLYQWEINDVDANTNSSTFTTNTLATGDRVNCIFTSSLPCNSPALSNTIAITVNQKTTSTVNKTICEGENYLGYTAAGTYIDSFTGINGCDSTRTLTLFVNSKQSTSEDTIICYGDSYYGHTVSGSYSHTYTGSNGCDSVHTINLTVLPDINRKVWNDTLLCIGDTIVISPGQFTTYLWQDGSTLSHYTITHNGSYSVVVSNQCGSATKQIDVTEQVCNVSFPTAFTPNSDGLNDVFKVVNAYNLSYFHLVLYNRWGQKIYESVNAAAGWNGFAKGKVADTGSYVWFCEFKKSNSSSVVKIKGMVTLLQ